MCVCFVLDHRIGSCPGTNECVHRYVGVIYTGQCIISINVVMFSYVLQCLDLHLNRYADPWRDHQCVCPRLNLRHSLLPIPSQFHVFARVLMRISARDQIKDEHTHELCDRNGCSLRSGFLLLAVAVMMRDPPPGGIQSGSGVRQERGPAPGRIHWSGSEDGWTHACDTCAVYACRRARVLARGKRTQC